MNTKYIEFKKKRELGDILTDTFGFLRTEFKPILATFFKIVGPYLLVVAIAFGMYLYSLGSILDFNVESSNEAFDTATAVVSVLLLLVSAIAAAALSQASILYYIESYIENNGETNFNEIKSKVYKNFWSFIGLGFLVGLSVIIGFIFCFIPGIYLYVPLSLTFAILVFGKKEALDAYNYSFTLIKDEWWITFATLFVIGIIVGIAGFAFNLPATIYSWMKLGILSGEVDPEIGIMDMYDPIAIFLNVFAFIFKLVLNLISIVAGVLIYFNLNEKKNFTGTYERIQNLGEDTENE